MASTYTVEYAKSSRGKCAACKQLIEKGTLRLCVASSSEDRTHTNNRHLTCLTSRVAANALKVHSHVDTLPGLDALSEEDRQLVRNTFEELTHGGDAAAGAAKEEKKGAKATATKSKAGTAGAKRKAAGGAADAKKPAAKKRSSAKKTKRRKKGEETSDEEEEEEQPGGTEEEEDSRDAAHGRDQD